jgi:hypothetical protein
MLLIEDELQQLSQTNAIYGNDKLGDALLVAVTASVVVVVVVL